MGTGYISQAIVHGADKMPTANYTISGHLYDTDGSTAIANARVKIRNESTNEVLNTEDTNASGEFVYNAGNFPSGWSDGDYITVFAIYTNYSASVTTQVDVSSYPMGRTQDLTLETVTESALRYYTPQEFLDTFSLSPYEDNNETGLKIDTIIKVGQAIEAQIDELTGRTWDDNQGSYYTATQEYHNCDGATSTWPDSIGSANVSSQSVYFTKNTPIQSVTTFQINKVSGTGTPSWTTLTEADNQIRVKGSIGRIEITDSSNFPAAGKDNVRITYTYGSSSVPYDIKRLAILMTAKSFAGQALQRLNIETVEAAGLNSAIQNLGNVDQEINRILDSRSLHEVRII